MQLHACVSSGTSSPDTARSNDFALLERRGAVLTVLRGATAVAATAGFLHACFAYMNWTGPRYLKVQISSVLLTYTLLTKTSSHGARVPSRVLVTLTDQWAGAGTPSMFCILEGSANIMAASALPGRQFISEPPIQLWGAAARKHSYVAVRYNCGGRIKGHPAS